MFAEIGLLLTNLRNIAGRLFPLQHTILFDSGQLWVIQRRLIQSDQAGCTVFCLNCNWRNSPLGGLRLGCFHMLCAATVPLRLSDLKGCDECFR